MFGNMVILHAIHKNKCILDIKVTLNEQIVSFRVFLTGIRGKYVQLS